MRRLVGAFVVGLTLLVVAPGAQAMVGAAKPPRPATAALTFAGDPGLAGVATPTQISCNFPSSAVDGSVMIFLLATPPNAADAFNMKVTRDKVLVTVSSGAGSSFVSRSFEGTGVKGFNAATGVRIDSPLTETTAENPSARTGTLGAITSITGSIDCGSQTAGKSTVKFSGTTAEGAVGGGARPFRVECDTSAAAGDRVVLVGIVKVGAEKALAFTTLGSESVTVFVSFPGPPASTHQYLVNTSGAATLSATGARVAADVVEQNPTNGSPHTLHLAGKVVCGSTVHR